jgi:hypothetical protein
MEIAKQIRKNQVDYILAGKDNQKSCTRTSGEERQHGQLEWWEVRTVTDIGGPAAFRSFYKKSVESVYSVSELIFAKSAKYFRRDATRELSSRSMDLSTNSAMGKM